MERNLFKGQIVYVWKYDVLIASLRITKIQPNFAFCDRPPIMFVKHFTDPLNIRMHYPSTKESGIKCTIQDYDTSIHPRYK